MSEPCHRSGLASVSLATRGEPPFTLASALAQFVGLTAVWPPHALVLAVSYSSQELLAVMGVNAAIAFSLEYVVT